MSELEMYKLYRNLGQQQKDILLWVAKQQGLFEERVYRKEVGFVYVDIYKGTQLERKRKEEPKDTQHEPTRGMLGDELYDVFYPEVREPPTIDSNTMKNPPIEWNSQQFQKTMDIKTSSASITKSLDSLENQNFVTCERLKGKGKRRSHIALTAQGIDCVRFLTSHGLGGNISRQVTQG